MSLFRPTLLCAALAGLCATSVHAAPKKPAPKAAPKAAVAAPVDNSPSTEIELVHTLGADKGAQLQKLVDRFNATNSGPKLVIHDRAWNAGAMPHLMILGERDLAGFLQGPQRYRPLFQVMKDAGVPMQTLKAPVTMTPTSLDAQKRLIALPVALSTPVLYYNKDAFKAAGLDPETAPKTWQELQATLGKLIANGQGCAYTTTQPAWILVENTSAWHNEPVVVEGKKESLAINGMLEVKHVAMLSSWYKARYLTVFGRDEEAIEHFTQGECAVLTAGSGAWPMLQRQSAFQVGIGALPYHEEYYGAPQNTLADGPAMWVAAGKKPVDYKVIAKFVDFWLTGESQVEWQRNAGYLPLNRAGLLASESKLLAPDLVNIRIAVQQLTNKPATSISKASTYPQRTEIRRIVNEELEEVWADRKPSKLALDNAVTRSRGH